MNGPDTSAAPWQLKPIAVTGLSERFPVVGTLTLGRAASNSVVLAETAYPQVSSHHARILCGEDGGLVVEDLGSRNGVFVNDRQVERAQLHSGDVLRLGTEGPRFVVERQGDVAATAVIHPARADARVDLTQTTMVRVRKALGLPLGAGIGDVVASSERRSRRLLRWTVTGTIVLVLGVVVVVRQLQHSELAQISSLNSELQARLSSASSAYEQQKLAWESQRQGLQQERGALQARIQDLAARAQTSQSELDQLRQQLTHTNDQLQRYDPVNVERARMQEIGRVQRCVVYIETKVHFRNTKTGMLLRVRNEATAATGPEVSFAETDPVFELESSGSGFCIAADGSIVTNAHVVHPHAGDSIELGPDERLQPEFVYAVVYSGTAERREARLVRALEDNDQDLALLRIEPFAQMPVLEGFRTDTVVPPTGAEVYLHGFPLGKSALQDGDRVIASSFRGILSRTVSNWLQVDAAVHPGNSGGPLTDASGRVIGVVTRVQKLAANTIAPEMGYVIPIAAVAQLWPLADGK